MKKSIIMATVLAFGLTLHGYAQVQSTNNVKGTNSRTTANTGTTEGLNKKGSGKGETDNSGKMKAGVSRSGDTNLSPTSPTNSKTAGSNVKTTETSAAGNESATETNSAAGTSKTRAKRNDPSVTNNGNKRSSSGTTYSQGSTSQGSGSVSSTGGAVGARTTEMRGKVRSNATGPSTTQGGLSGPGAANTSPQTSTASTSGTTGGSKRPASEAGVQKESKTNDKNVGTGYPEPTGPGKPGTPASRPKAKSDNKQ